MRTHRSWQFLAILAAAAATALGGALLLHQGIYGFALFVILPAILGALTECLRKSRTAGESAMWGAASVMFASVLFLAAGAEGVICMIMAIPLTAPLGALGGYLAFVAAHALPDRTGTAAFLLLLPLSAGTLGFDLTARPSVFEVHSSIEIAASPERVWKYVVSFSELPPPGEWFFKAGVAYPDRAHIVGRGAGAVRYCEFSTGPFVEPIEVWDEPRLLQFSVTSSPPPLREWSPYGEIQPKHLHGYLISKQGQFRLTPLANGHTLLEGTTWYQHRLWPAQYWTLWSNAIIHKIHLRVLAHIKTLAESTAR